MVRIVILLFALVSALEKANADCYMHNPRGSNDRNCERNVNRNNGNRLFDSQNNNKGGYACPRGVGNGEFQAEDGTASFSVVNPITATTTTFTQNKRVYYYSGSVLPIEWTNQHGCGGNSKVSCEIVLQYACEDTLDPKIDNFWPWVQNKAEPGTTYFGKQHFRSGTNIAAPRDGVPRDDQDAATDTIPDNEASAIPNSVATRRYGMHESYDSYQLCQRTQRNKGLYTADQLIRRNDQRGTRQNPNGNRRGLECPEERDYYPWWHPSPWIDIAVLTDNTNPGEICYPSDAGTGKCSTRCEYYMANTMNFNRKGYCDVSHNVTEGATVQTKLSNRRWQQRNWYNNKDECEAGGFTWYEVSHSDNLNLASNNFVCAHTQFARANQLGNARSDLVVSQSQAQSAGVVKDAVSHGVNANRFLWTIPDIPTAVNASGYVSSAGMEGAYKSCALRIRYNISTGDFNQWPDDAVDAGMEAMVDHRNNSRYREDPRTPIKQNPYVYIGPGDTEEKGDMFVKLKVNTNQYGRTFQDRSYVFTIKPLPTANADARLDADTPPIDYDAMNAALSSGGKIYNVNVRGKRGNIVQTYPAVEYDFVPNALALSTNDMIHFQWTGSDYNPRRGCNDATGGPPDLNTYSTSANTNKNPRADRSNVMFMEHMAFNVPQDYQGYDNSDTSLSFADKEKTANATALQNVPCYDPATDSDEEAVKCYEQVKRLAYLNQQSDSGSLTLREGKECYTADELNQIQNQDQADFHPLNCAKMNAKPYPYFDGGVMMMKKKGWFPYFSSRNNNFSNREQVGVVCVGGDCKVDNDTSVLQDQNPQTNGVSSTAKSAATAVSECYDTASGQNGANSNGVTSCLPPEAELAAFDRNASILSAEAFGTQEGDNDGKGDGNEKGCATLSFTDEGSHTVEDNVALALILLFVGLFLSWLAYYLYNRYQARRENDSKFRYDTAWQTAGGTDRKARPASGTFSEINMMKTGAAGGAAAAAAGAGSFSSSSSKSPSSPTSRSASGSGSSSSGGAAAAARSGSAGRSSSGLKKTTSSNMSSPPASSSSSSSAAAAGSGSSSSTSKSRNERSGSPPPRVMRTASPSRSAAAGGGGARGTSSNRRYDMI